MTSQPDPNSKRSRKRANRNFSGSRPQRRAERRARYAELAYRAAVRAANGDPKGYTVPGANKMWKC